MNTPGATSQPLQSEIARVMAEIEQRAQAAHRGIYDFAQVGRHDHLVTEAEQIALDYVPQLEALFVAKQAQAASSS